MPAERLRADPDADRCGVVIKVPENQRHIYDSKDYYLLPADDMWTLVLWYRLFREREKHKHVIDADKKFIVLSHTTSDGITSLARKYGLGIVKTWVGFAALAIFVVGYYFVAMEEHYHIDKAKPALLIGTFMFMLIAFYYFLNHLNMCTYYR